MAFEYIYVCLDLVIIGLYVLALESKQYRKQWCLKIIVNSVKTQKFWSNKIRGLSLSTKII